MTETIYSIERMKNKKPRETIKDIIERMKNKKPKDKIKEILERIKNKKLNLFCHPGFPKAVADASNNFSVEMYKEALREKDPRDGFLFGLFRSSGKSPKNVVMSAFSVFTVLSMLRVGAQGDTRKQITEKLALPGRAANNGHRCLLPKLKSKDFTLAVANRIYIRKGFNPKSSFLDKVRKNFYSRVGETDFEKSTQAAREINGWVEKQTMQKIKDLVKPQSLNSKTKLVLVNAIYFKADWAKKFDNKLTMEKRFYTTEVGGQPLVSMMAMEDFFKVR